MATATSARILCPPLSLPKPNSLAFSIAELLRSLNPTLPHAPPPDQNNNNPTPTPLAHFASHLNPNLVIQVIKTVTDPNHALFFFNWASSPSPNPNNYTHTFSCYVAMLDHLLSRRLFTRAAHFLETRRKLCDFTAAKMIKACGDQCDIRAAVHWFHRVKSLENGNCRSSYNSILTVLGKSGRISMARAIFDQMVEELVVQPDVWTYTIMIRGYCKRGMVGDARKVFDEMTCTPNLVTYNTLIAGLCKKGLMTEARELVVERMMTGDGGSCCMPDEVTYTTLIDGYCKNQELEEARACMDEMIGRNLQGNTITYNALIHGLCLAGKVDDARRMMTKMRLTGLRDDVVTHTSLLLGLCRVGRLEEAIKHLRDNMLSLRIKPDVKAYGVILNECCKQGRMDEAMAFLQQMKWNGIAPMTSSFNAVLRGLKETGDVDRAVGLLRRMPDVGCCRNFLSYSLVISSLCATAGGGRSIKELDETVSDMVRSGHKLDCSLYSSLVKRYCEEGDEEMGTQIFADALKSGHVIDVNSFAALVEGLCKKGRVSEAEKHFNECCNTHHRVVQVENYRRVLDMKKMSNLTG